MSAFLLIFFISILSYDIEEALCQGAYQVQMLVGLNAAFSFQLNTTDTNSTFVIRNTNGLELLFVRGTTVLRNDERVNFTGITYQKHVAFILRNVTLYDAGWYNAYVYGNYTYWISSAVEKQMLIVKDSPTKPQIKELNIAESGSSYRLNCSTQSKSAPPDHGLVMTAKWKRNGAVITSGGQYIIKKTELTISNLRYEQDSGARFTCFAYEEQLAMSVESDAHIIYVKYGPAIGQVVFSPPESQLQVEENSTVNISCSADCYPLCNYTWTGPQGFSLNGAHLSRVLDRNKGGIYTCTATNQENTGKTASADVTVTVFYGPGSSINLGSISSTLYVFLDQKVPNVTCNATCNPICNYTWYKNGDFYSSGATLSVGMVEKKTEGKYTCEAYNNFQRSMFTSVTITVLLPSTSGSVQLSVAGIAGGILGTAFGVILIIGIVIFLWRRYQHKQQNEHDSGVEMELPEREYLPCCGRRQSHNQNLVNFNRCPISGNAINKSGETNTVTSSPADGVSKPIQVKDKTTVACGRPKCSSTIHHSKSSNAVCHGTGDKNNSISSLISPMSSVSLQGTEYVLKEHFDVCIIYSEADENDVYAFKDHLEKLDLGLGEHPNICLYTEEKVWGPAKLTEKASFVCKHCTLIFVYLSKRSSPDEHADFFRNEVLMATVKNSRVRPVLSEKDCAIPFGLNNVPKIKWYKRDERSYKEDILSLFATNIPIRLRREEDGIKSTLSTL